MSESKSLYNISNQSENPKEFKEEKKDEIEESKVKEAQEYKNESNLSNSELNTAKQKSDISEDSQGMKKNEKKSSKDVNTSSFESFLSYLSQQQQSGSYTYSSSSSSQLQNEQQQDLKQESESNDQSTYQQSQQHSNNEQQPLISQFNSEEDLLPYQQTSTSQQHNHFHEQKEFVEYFDNNQENSEIFDQINQTQQNPNQSDNKSNKKKKNKHNKNKNELDQTDGLNKDQVAKQLKQFLTMKQQAIDEQKRLQSEKKGQQENGKEKNEQEIKDIGHIFDEMQLLLEDIEPSQIPNEIQSNINKLQPKREEKQKFNENINDIKQVISQYKGNVQQNKRKKENKSVKCPFCKHQYDESEIDNHVNNIHNSEDGQLFNTYNTNQHQQQQQQHQEQQKNKQQSNKEIKQVSYEEKLKQQINKQQNQQYAIIENQNDEYEDEEEEEKEDIKTGSNNKNSNKRARKRKQQKEKKRLIEMEKQKIIELEKQKQNELEKQKQIEKEKLKAKFNLPEGQQPFQTAEELSELINNVKQQQQERMSDIQNEQLNQVLQSWINRGQTKQQQQQPESEIKHLQQLFKQFNDILRQNPNVGTAIQKKQIFTQQMQTCLQLNQLFRGKFYTESRNAALESGVVEALIHNALIQDNTNAEAFTIPMNYLTRPCSVEFFQGFTSKNPIPAFVRVLDRKYNDRSVENAMDSLHNLIFSLCIPIRFDTPHPLFEQLSACNGINKIFELFCRSGNKEIKDQCAFCIAYVHRVREIKDIRIRRQIIQHVLIMYDNHDEKVNGLGSIAFNCLSLNQVNLDEIMKGDILVQIRDTLMMEIKGNEKQRKFMFDKLERKCKLLTILLKARQDEEFKVLIIDIGIIDALLNIYATYDFKLLTQTLTSILQEFMMNSKYKSIKQFISRNPYPALIRLLDHPDGSVSMICIFFIHNLLSCAINETHRTALHPHYDIIASCDGIQKIYSQFKRNAYFYLRDYTAICIGFIHKARKIENAQMRRDIIAHLKIISLSQTDQKHKERRALTFLALNDVNNKEIEKDGFKIPQFEEGEIFDDGDDVYDVQEQDEQQQEEKKDCITQ